MPRNPSAMKDAIQSKVGNLMERVMDRVLNSDPFIVEKFRAEKPLYAALVPDEIFKGSHFERRFVTPFGSVWEDLAVTAAEYGLGSGKKGVTLTGTVKEERLRRISEVLNRLEHTEKGNTRMGTYQAFIDAVNEIGAQYKERIYRDFLGIEPPQGTENAGKLE